MNEDFFTVKKISSQENDYLGEEKLKEGKIGYVLLAAGQGTRLDFSKPKGCYPIYSNKSLFELFCEKILKAQTLLNISLPVAIMVSAENENETKDFFQKNDFFGLNEKDLFFFKQSSLPLMNARRNWISKKNVSDGNGSLYKSFLRSKVFFHFKKRNVESVMIIPVDNPLANPFDSNLIGFHFKEGSDVTILSIIKDDPDENMGILIKRKDKIQIQEYLHMTTNQKDVLGNTGVFVFSMNYIYRAASIRLQYHLIKKKINRRVFYKYERFIFDAFSEANRMNTLCYPREICYAPLKKRIGKNGIQSVKRALECSHNSG